MKPADFTRKSTEIAAASGGDYRLVAGPANVGDGLQATVHIGTDFETNRSGYLLHVADTDPNSTAFGSQTFRPGEIDPVDSGIRFENVNMATFEGLGSLTVPYPE